MTNKFSGKGCMAMLLGLLFISRPLSAEVREWDFRVFLNDTEIGYHRFVLDSEKSSTRVESRARFDVKFLFFNAFKYRHENTELWEGDCLKRIDARTNSNGNIYEIDGMRQGHGRFHLETKSQERILEGCVKTFAYWNPDHLGSTALLNSQTGEYMEVDLVRVGSETVKVGDKYVNAVKYRLQGKGGIDIRLWYSQDKHWLALESRLESGRTLRYRLQSR